VFNSDHGLGRTVYPQFTLVTDRNTHQTDTDGETIIRHAGFSNRDINTTL